MADPWILDASASDHTVAETLREFGLAIVPEALARENHAALSDELSPCFAATPFCQGLFYGQHTRRFGRVLAKSRTAQELALHPLSHGTAKTLLGESCEDIQLNLTQAIEISPGSLSQAPHRDQDIWLGADFPSEMMLNAMWAIDDFTRDNGATVVWPGTHRQRGFAIPETEGVPAVMPAGSLCLFTGSVVHNGGANWSDRSRRGLVMSYCLGWLKPAENPWLSYPPEIACHFAPELQHLIGYRQDAPSLNQVDGRCPSELLRSDRATNDAASLPFAENLKPEQEMLIARFNEMQLAYRPLAA